jgi:hypothetical protein
MSNIQKYIENPIKRHILGLLMKHKQLRYSDLMPADTDNVLFNYHLQHLVKNKLIDKSDDGYSLSQMGIQETSNITYNGLYFPKFTCRFKMYLINKDKVLLQHRQRTPWYGDVSAMSSKLVYGSNVEQRANLRMQQKSSLTTKMKWLGTIRTLAVNKSDDLLDDSIYFVCVATDHEGEVSLTDDNKDTLQWHTFAEAIDFAHKNRGEGQQSIEVIKRLKTGIFDPFAFEERIVVNNL